MESMEALETANGYIAQVTSIQTFILRLGMVLIPMAAMLSCYFLIKKKYKIDEEMYASMVAEIESRNS